MFPDSDVTQLFLCGENKWAYFTTFDVVPHFVSLMKANDLGSGYVLLVDASITSGMKKYQLDVDMKVWKDNST